MSLVPFFETIPTVRLVYGFFALGPSGPSRLRFLHDAHHLVRHWQLCINGGCKWMYQFRPVVVPKPQHGTAVRTKVPLGGAKRFIWSTTVFDGGVFAGQDVSTCSSHIMQALQIQCDSINR